MTNEVERGRCIGLGALDGVHVDTLRLTYTVLPLLNKQDESDPTNGYDAIALVDSEITYQRALECVDAAMKTARREFEAGAALVCSRHGSVRAKHLSIHLDWSVENYFNETDLLTNGGVVAHEHDMLIVFAPNCSPEERVVSLQLFKRTLLENGLPKGVVAMGNERYVTVYDRKDGHRAVEW